MQSAAEFEAAHPHIAPILREGFNTFYSHVTDSQPPLPAETQAMMREYAEMFWINSRIMFLKMQGEN